MQSPSSNTVSSKDLGLRPVPGPTPIPESLFDWWLIAVPLVLLGCILWFRKIHSSQKNERMPLERLNRALENCINSRIEAKCRFLELDSTLRSYLAWRDNSSWLTTPANQSSALWEKLFPHDRDLARKWFKIWQESDNFKYGQELLTEEQFQLYVADVKALQQSIEGKMKNV